MNLRNSMIQMIQQYFEMIHQSKRKKERKISAFKSITVNQMSSISDIMTFCETNSNIFVQMLCCCSIFLKSFKITLKK